MKTPASISTFSVVTCTGIEKDIEHGSRVPGRNSRPSFVVFCGHGMWDEKGLRMEGIRTNAPGVPY